MKEQNDVIEYTDKKGKIRIINNDSEASVGKKKKKTVITVLIILIMAMTAVFVYYNSDSINSAYILQWLKSDVLGINKGSGYPIEIVGNTIEKNNTGMLNRYFSYISDTTFNILNTTAGEIRSVQHGYASPSMKCAGAKVLTYDLGGTAYSIEGTKGAVYNGKIEDKIYCAAISESGVYGIAHETSGFLSDIQIFDKNNKFLYSYKMSEYYAVSMSINSDGTGCAVAGVSTKSGKIVSKIYILDFKQEKPLSVFSFDDNLIFDIAYVGNGKVACVGDSASYVIDINSKKTSDYGYDGKAISAYVLKPGYGIALSLSPSQDGKKCMLVYIDTEGSVLFEIQTELAIADIDACTKSNKTAVYSRGFIYLYSPSGELFTKCECNKDVKSITMINDRSVYTAGVSEINYINITY